MQLYKFKHEIIPYCGAGLAPRNYLVNYQWKMLMAKRTEEIGGKFCELCNSTEKLDFHESFEIKNCVYILKGMFWLCRTCHSKVHIKGNKYEYPSKYTHYNGIRKINNQLFTARKEAFKFSTHLNVSVDYSWLGNYGIDFVSVENKWRCGDYNHKYVILRFITDCIRQEKMNKHIYACAVGEYPLDELDKYSITLMKLMFGEFKDFFIPNMKDVISGKRLSDEVKEYVKT